MARKPIPGKDEGTWGEILNEYLNIAHASDGSLRDGSVSEGKLTPGVRSKLNAASGGDVADGAVTTAKLDDGAVTNAKIAANADIAQSKVANLTSDLANKADTSHGHAVADVTDLQSILDGKAAASHTHAVPSLDLDDLTDVNTSGATSGQVLTWQGSQWSAADQTGGSGSGGVTDHGALNGLGDDDHPQYLNNTRGDARYYTRSQIDSSLGDKANTTHVHGAADINSGVLNPARLGSGTASASTVLYGDGAWKTAPSGGGGATNLSSSATATNVTVASDTGTDTTLAAATSTNAGVLSATDKAKLDSVDSGATANATDAQLRDRSTHSGSQAIATVSGLQAALDDKAASEATVNLTGNQTVAGTKTFSSSPVVPAPTTDMQVATKKYVDDNAGGGGGGGNALSVNSINATEYGAGFSDRTQGYQAPANQWVICDTATSGLGVTLQTPTAGAWVKVKKQTNDSNAVIVWPPAGQQISAGDMTSNTISVNNYGQSYDFWGDGSQWHIA